MRRHCVCMHWLWPVILVLLVFSMHFCAVQVKAQASSRGERVRQWPAHEGPDFQAFAHTWVAHGSSLFIAANGQAMFEERTYIWCSSDVQGPCDRILHERIYPGYREIIQFTRIEGATAYGEIRASNLQPIGATVMARLQPHDTLQYIGRKGLLALLCGPQAPIGTCGA